MLAFNLSLVDWSLNESETGVDLALIQNLPAFLMLMMLFPCKVVEFNKKSSEVSITRSTLTSLSFKGQATKHTTVKCSIFIDSVVKSFVLDLAVKPIIVLLKGRKNTLSA